MRFLSPLLLLALFLSGCVSGPEKSYTIHGHNARNVVLYASKEINASGLRLPPGYYYPVREFNGQGLLVRNYRMEFYHPAGVMARDLIGQWFNAPGGISVDYDPSQKPPHGIVSHEGLNIASGTFSPGAIQFIERAGAWNSPESLILRGELDAFHQQQMYRDAQGAAVQGALMALPR